MKNRAFIASALVLLVLPAWGDLVDPQDMPGPLKQVGFEQNLGAQLPLDAPFLDASGREVVLGDYFSERPVIMVFVYYRCPMLCPTVLNGVAKSLGVLEFDVGKEFDVVAVSIDPNESSEQARSAKRVAVKRYGRGHTAPGWHFLRGGEESIRRVTETAGFGYAFVPENGEYAHASGIVVATPEGQLAQYFYGIDFAPKHVRLALVEASSNRIGSVVDQILLYCFRYDPELGQYTAVITRILRLAGVVFCLALALFLWINLRRERVAARHPSSILGAASR
ncbi:MAG: SCO family protein [Acidobacteriota bacterium]